MKKRRRDNSSNVTQEYDSCLLHFFSLTTMYVQSFISIPFQLSKIWPGKATIMEQNWLRGDNLVNIQGTLWFLCTALPIIFLHRKPCICDNFLMCQMQGSSLLQ